MNDYLAPAQDRLIAHLTETARGPKRNGAFALWLFMRACDDELPPGRLSSRTRRRRLADLERRLSSLSIHPPLKRALGGGLHALGEQTPEAAVRAIEMLTAPAGEHIGPEAADALSLAARHAKSAIRQAEQIVS
jgi:hypothetical protein